MTSHSDATAPSAAPSPGVLEIRPHGIVAVALAVLGALVVLNLLVMPVWVTTGSSLVRQLCRLVMMDAEANLPTFYNFGLFIAMVGLLAVLALRAWAERRPWRWHWLALCLLFLLLAYDEAAQFHENLVGIMGLVIERTGLLYFAWVIPGAAFAALVGVVFLRFVLALPRRESMLVLLGGGLYVSGAIGIEMLGGALAEQTGFRNFWYQLTATLEETLEMLGLIIFGSALLNLIAGRDGVIRIAAE